jgi:hypothetical protein
VIVDTELETWRREWQSQTEPLPKLKKKIKRQNQRTIAAIALMCACLVVSTIEALRTRSSFMVGVAVGVWFAALVLGGYSWWVQRGTWKPEAQTTRAYLELSYKRAVAKARMIRFSIYVVLAVTILLSPILLWNWRTLHGIGPLVLAALLAELFYFKYLGRRKKREIEETRRLMEQADEGSDAGLVER